ncbi:hypothetical protein BS78_05G270200 [Paspalum vaginatum]|nr:hypothetical protein BS78_05G270200 [Paspalum vaginatum]
MGEEEVIQRSREILDSGDKQSLVVIDGLRSKDEWDTIKSNILPAEPAKCYVVVVTDDQHVASYCVDGVENRLVHVTGVDMHTPAGQMDSCRRERELGLLRRISDRHLSWRRLIYEDRIDGCMMGESAHVVSVWEIAGVGKSALLRWSFTKKMLDPKYQHRFRHYYWVDVPHPFSVAELSLRLLMELHSDYPEAKETKMVDKFQGKDLIHECRVWLYQHEGWLLVLDGLRSADDWDSVNNALSLSQPAYNSSRTIVITNQQTVAMHCVNGKKQADEPLQLFNLKINNNITDMEPLEKELPQSILVKCGGLPKVIDAVAEWYNKSFDGRKYLKLKDINDNFMKKLEGFHSLRGLFSWMQSYLETCRDDPKPCIFYLPVFPIGHNIRFRRLRWRWIAEGYLRGTSSHTEKKNVKRLLKDLLEFSMIQLQSSSKSEQCQVNGFFHEYISSRPMEDNLVLALRGIAA